jgi:hypothetical protein
MTSDNKYAYDVKREWRRTIWKEIAARVPAPLPAAKVVYLAGPNNYDCWEATKHGFSPRNMTIVERDGDLARSLRKRFWRQVVVEGDLCEVLVSLAIRERIDVVIADFVSGLTDKMLLEMSFALASPGLKNATVVVNLQCGREHAKHDFSRLLVRVFKEQGLTQHRGKQFLVGCSELTSRGFAAQGWSRDSQAAWANAQFLRWHATARCGRYKAESGKLTFDTVVFKNDHDTTMEADAVSGLASEYAPTTRAIAAARAVRTMSTA